MEMTTPSSTSTNPALEAVVAAIFHKMQLDYGKKFTDQWSGSAPTDLREHWASELTGYTPREIKRGLAAMEGQDWPPTLPAFKKLCRPPINHTVAYYEAIAGVQARAIGEMGKWSHPATFWAAMPLSFDLSSQTYSQIKVRWEAALDEQMARGEWEPIPNPTLALPAPGRAQMSKESAAEMMRQLEASGATKKVTDRIDHKRWAKRIMQRIADGDKTVTMIQGQFAREELNQKEEVTG